MTLAVGQRLPIGIAVSSPQGPIAISDLLPNGPGVVAFHRLWCPFCQQAARELASIEEDITQVGGQVVIVYRELSLRCSGPNVKEARRSCA